MVEQGFSSFFFCMCEIFPSSTQYISGKIIKKLITSGFLVYLMIHHYFRQQDICILLVSRCVCVFFPLEVLNVAIIFQGVDNHFSTFQWGVYANVIWSEVRAVNHISSPQQRSRFFNYLVYMYILTTAIGKVDFWPHHHY